MRYSEGLRELGVDIDSLDVEMIEILGVLNIDLGIKTKHSCIGHSDGEETYIMFDESVEYKDILMLIKVVDENIGTSGAVACKIYSWLRMMYKPYFKQPHYPVNNWILEISRDYDKNFRETQLERITTSLKRVALHSVAQIDE